MAESLKSCLEEIYPCVYVCLCLRMPEFRSYFPYSCSHTGRGKLPHVGSQNQSSLLEE